MKSIRRLSWCIAGILALSLVPSLFAIDDDELRDQQEKQRQVQAETDHVVRRITTMLRVMQFYKLESADKKVMEEMSGTLNKLSKNQMTEVVRQLEAAATASDENQSEVAMDKAYQNHRQVVTALHELLARYDAVKSLEQAADKFEMFAKQQFDLSMQTNHVTTDLRDFNDPKASEARKDLLRNRMKNQGTEMKRQGDVQGDLARDVGILVKQVKELSPRLNVDQQARIKNMNKLILEYRLGSNLQTPAAKLGTRGFWQVRVEQFEAAMKLQDSNALQLQQLARVLRVPSDNLSILKEASEKIEQAIAKQEGIKEEIKTNLEGKVDPNLPAPKDDKGNLKFPDLNPLPTPANQKELAAQADKNTKLAEQQAKLAFDTKDTANLLQPIAKDAAKALDNAESAMKNAKENLAKNDPKKAVAPQDKATDNLKNAKAEIDKMIAAAEKAKNDPLAAVKNAIEKIDNIIKEQTKTQADTRQTKQESPKLADLSKEQKNLASKTDDVKNMPLPNKENVENALDKATQAMKQAVKNLDAKQSPEAVAKQDKALDALNEARKELADKAAEIEKRRDDIAKLEDAAQKLEQIAKQEKGVANQADKNATQPKADPKNNQELSKEQANITPKAADLAKEIDKAAPKAAEKIGESTKNMDAAKQELAKNQAKPGATEAKEAGKKLDEAQKALQNALAELKAKEINEQAALQKNTDPLAAAQQVAKAIEEANKAAEAAKQAETTLEPQKLQADLAKQQADLAKQADAQKLPDAAKEAEKAAEALKNNDFEKAIENQAKAFEKLQDAAKNAPREQGAKNDPMAKPGEAKPGEAKKGEQPAQPKKNQAQPGEAKDAGPMAKNQKGEPKQGQTKPGEPKDSANAKKGDQPQAKSKNDGAEKKGNPQSAQAKPGSEPKQGTAKNGEPKQGQQAQAKAGEAKAGEAKAGQAKQGTPKDGQPNAQAKAGQPKDGNPMAAGKKDGQPNAQAKGQQPTPGQLAQQQKALMDATKAMGQQQAAANQAAQQQAQANAAKQQQQSQNATQAAQAALAQAQAQAPQAVQPQLQKAQQQLQQAQQNLQQGQPGQAGDNQQQAAKDLGKALDALNQALAQQGQPGQQPGEPGTAKGDPMTAKADGKDGQGKDGQGEPKDGQGKDGQGKDGKGQQAKGNQPGNQKGQQAKSDERNDTKGEGDRKADGTVSNKASQFNDVKGDGNFMYLPPRQRELIRQAISGNLPPEYANLIQQYYVNIARGRAATGGAPSAPPPPPAPPR